jgi:hypothetical protein
LGKEKRRIVKSSMGIYLSMNLINKPSVKILLFFCLILTACIQPRKDKDYVFVVSTFNKPTDPREPPPPPMPTYAPFNFIVDTSGLIYYYQLQIGKPRCASGIHDNLTPPFIGLQPQNIVQIPEATLMQFIKSNLHWLNQDYKFISIASPVDTVKKASFKSLIEIFSDTTFHVRYSIRKTTQEENVVLDHKVREVYYDADSQRWDSTRISFPPKFTN